MTPSRSRDQETARILVVGDGDIARCAVTLISRCGEKVDTAPVGPVAPNLAGYAAVAFAASRPYPVLERSLDEACWALRVPWTSGIVIAHEFRLGPSIVPGRTPCRECWRRRVRSHASDLAAYDAIDEFGSNGPTGTWFTGELSVLTEQVAALLAAEVVSLADRSYPLPPTRLGRYWEGDAVYGHLQAHLFARVGLCSRCGASDRATENGSSGLAVFVRNVLRSDRYGHRSEE